MIAVVAGSCVSQAVWLAYKISILTTGYTASILLVNNSIIISSLPWLLPVVYDGIKPTVFSAYLVLLLVLLLCQRVVMLARWCMLSSLPETNFRPAVGPTQPNVPDRLLVPPNPTCVAAAASLVSLFFTLGLWPSLAAAGADWLFEVSPKSRKSNLQRGIQARRPPTFQLQARTPYLPAWTDVEQYINLYAGLRKSLILVIPW